MTYKIYILFFGSLLFFSCNEDKSTLPMLFRTSVGKLGADQDFYIARTLHWLARYYQKHGFLSESEFIYKLALVVRKLVLEPNNAWITTSLNDLAVTCRQMGKLEDAEQIHRQVLCMRKRNFGNLHPSVAHTLANLGQVYSSQRRWKDAEFVYLRALAIYTHTFGSCHPEVEYVKKQLSRVHTHIHKNKLHSGLQKHLYINASGSEFALSRLTPV